MKGIFNTVWCLCFKNRKKMIIGLTPREVQAIMASLEPGAANDVYVWSAFIDDWKPISQFTKLMSYTGLDMPDNPPIFDFKAIEQRTDDDNKLDKLVSRNVKDELHLSEIQMGMVEDISDLLIDNVNRKHKSRNFTRYKREFPVELEANGKIFKTTTTDISPGGMLLKDPLPDWINGYFSTKIFQPLIEQSLIHTGWVVDSDKQVHRKHVAFLPFKIKKAEEQFEEWIKSAA